MELTIIILSAAKSVKDHIMLDLRVYTYNRLALTKCYLLDIDLALYVPWLPSKVKLNKSWIYFFIMDNSFYSNQRKGEKSSGESQARTWDLLAIRLAP